MVAGPVHKHEFIVAPSEGVLSSGEPAPIQDPFEDEFAAEVRKREKCEAPDHEARCSAASPAPFPTAPEKNPEYKPGGRGKDRLVRKMLCKKRVNKRNAARQAQAQQEETKSQ